MLYVTTREKYDAYTAYRAKTMDRAADGGFFLPYRMPSFTAEEVAALKDCSFGKCVARMLNCFFSTQLTGWDVEFCIGRYPVKVTNVTNKVLQLETWRNLDGSYEMMERNLAALVCGCVAEEAVITSWLRIAIRISVTVGVVSELLRQGILDETHPIDVAVASGDFSLPMAMWYCRQIGLPLANIICSCEESSPVWDLLHFGELRITGSAPAETELERLIFGVFGVDEVNRFSKVCAEGGEYALAPHCAQALSHGLFSAVVSRDRTESVISNVYRTGSCFLEPNAAMAYGGLMDYRAKTGESRTAVIFADRNPADVKDLMAAAMNIPQSELSALLDKK